MDIFFIGIALIFFGGLLSVVIREKYKTQTLAIFSGIGSIAVVRAAAEVLFSGSSLSITLFFPNPLGVVVFCVDGLSAFFLIVISLMSFLGTIYSIGYLKPYIGKSATMSSHCFFISLLIISQMLVVTVSNSLAFLIVWEIMSLSSFFLVVFENEKEEAYKAGLNYLITMHVGVLFLIVGFIILSIKTISNDFSSFRDYFASIQSGFPDLLFLVFFIGFGLKAGFFPLHSWLPKAHPAAPSNISGMMSGIMIKTGIYGILRILYIMGAPSVYAGYFVLIISIISALLGVIYAIAQHDLKKLLAYHSVENIGIIGIGIGIGMLGISYGNPAMAFLGFSGGILHVLNHSIFKELLFYGAGSVYLQTHTRNIEELGGVGKRMPVTSATFLIGSAAICGLPPLNGFISEFLIYLGMALSLSTGKPILFMASILSMASLALVGAMALLCFTKAFSVVFLGSARTPKSEHAVENERLMLMPMLILTLFIFMIGLFPQKAILLVSKPALLLIGGSAANLDILKYSDLLQHISLCALGFVILAMLIYSARFFLLRGRKVYLYKTWDCGYQAGNTRMQYTASSFAKSFIWLVKFLIGHDERLEKPVGVFPQKASYESSTKDLFDSHVIAPMLKAIKKFLDLFAWIQSGSAQQYILYGLIFLLCLLLYILISLR